MNRWVSRFALACATLPAACYVAAPASLRATPYASNVTISGTTVNFILNEPADVLTYSLNGGAAIALNGTSKGPKTFMLGAASDTFSIRAEKTAATGFTIPTGAMTPTPINPDTTVTPPIVGQEYNGLRIASNLGGTNIISDDSSVLTRFNSPRGLDVNKYVGTPNFGTAYISNSAAGTHTASGRTLGDGMYALRADGSDAFGYGDVAQNPIVTGDTLPAFHNSSPASPWHVTVSNSGQVLVGDFYDNNSNAFTLNPNLTTAQNFFVGYTGTTPPPAGQNHGSVLALHTTGSLATGDLVVYTIDEDITSQFFIDGTNSNVDRNSVWRYDIGSGPLPSTVTPTRVATGLLGFASQTVDFDISPSGKFFMSNFRFAGSETGLIVAAPDGTQLYSSLDASRTLLNDPAANDILTSAFAVTVSPDEKWVAVLLNRSDVAVMPLVNGLPDLAQRLVIDTTTTDTENSGRDIAFDAAGNIHYVSSGQGRYRVLAPGGHTLATTSWNGTALAFNVQNVVSEDADFDNDQDVDGHDLMIWQQHVGTGTTNMQGDANGDSSVNGADLGIWKTKYGMGGTTAAAVPEPAAACLAAVALLALAGGRKRRNEDPSSD